MSEPKLSADELAWVEAAGDRLDHHPELLRALLLRTLRELRMLGMAAQTCLNVLHSAACWHQGEVHFFVPHDGTKWQGEVLQALGESFGEDVEIYEGLDADRAAHAKAHSDTAIMLQEIISRMDRLHNLPRPSATAAKAGPGPSDN